MAEVKILIKGYVSEDSDQEKTCSTTSLIRDKDLNIVVDPGVLESQQILVDALAREGLTIPDINIVFITHSHMDHYRNIGMFPEAKSLDYWGFWDGNMVEDWKEQFTDNIKIIKTPGHNYDGLTFLVKTEKGVVAICGDVFWEKYSPENDPYASDKKKLEKSRKEVLKLADYIVPGHAGMFKVGK